METKETILRTNTENKLLEDVEYYKFIFKKTEKIACAVFYITRSKEHISHNDTVVNDLERSAQSLIDVSLESLKSTTANSTQKVFEVKYALMRLESLLRVTCSSRLLGAELLDVFLHEIDSVHRSLRKYIESGIINPLAETRAVQDVTRERKIVRSRPEVFGLQGGTTTSAPLISRRERVLNVLRDKGDATIKDIIEVIKDCSEKTIQRELINLIKDSIVVREGERRWSKYKLI